MPRARELNHTDVAMVALDRHANIGVRLEERNVPRGLKATVHPLVWTKQSQPAHRDVLWNADIPMEHGRFLW